jgi:lysyl-tRNA synthetase class II
MLELYESFADLGDMMEITEALFSSLAEKVHGSEEIKYGEKVLSFKRPWRRLSFYQALQEKTDVDWQKVPIKEAARRIKLPPPTIISNAIFMKIRKIRMPWAKLFFNLIIIFAFGVFIPD